MKSIPKFPTYLSAVLLASPLHAFVPAPSDLIALQGNWLQRSPAKAIASNPSVNMVIQQDGSVLAWGENSADLTTIPQGLKGVKSLALVDYGVLALKEDSTLVTWGSSGSVAKSVPSGLTKIVAISARGDHAAAIRPDSSVVVWGPNWFGITTVPAGLTKAVAVSVGSSLVAALKPDGTVVVWGDSSKGATRVPDGLNNVVSVHAGTNYVLALRGDGTVASWGDTSQSVAKPPASLKDVIALSAGSQHALAILKDSSIVGWGRNYSQETTPPVKRKFVAVCASMERSLALTADGEVIGWGKEGAVSYNTAPTTLIDVRSMAFGYDHALARLGDGSVVSWGANSKGESSTPTLPLGASRIAVADLNSFALVSDTVYQWGSRWLGSITPPLPPPGRIAGVIDITAGNAHAAILGPDGALSIWGSSASPVTKLPADLRPVKAVASGNLHILALQDDSTIRCWGSNTFGQCDVPGFTSKPVGVRAFGYQSAALLADGSAVTWGSEGNLATASAGFTKLKDLVLGAKFAAGLTTDGSVVAAGTLGSNSSAKLYVPAGFKARAIFGGGYQLWALRDTSQTVGIQDQAPIPEQFIRGPVRVLRADGTPLWSGTVSSLREIRRNRTFSGLGLVQELATGRTHRILVVP